MPRVTVEVLPGMGGAAGRQGARRRAFEMDLAEDHTIGGVLRRMAAADPQLAGKVFDRGTGDLLDGVAIVLNGRFSQVTEGLDTPVADGDVVTLVFAFAGG